MLDKATVVATANRYAGEVVKKYNPLAVVLFGSYVNGTPHEDSDIDIAVVFNGSEGDWLSTAKDLWRISSRISYSIEPHLLDTSDDQSGFAHHVLHTGDVIYQA